MIRIIANLCSALIDALGALWVLADLEIRSKFNLRSPYWTWRLSTAFPSPKPGASKPSILRLTLEYARWASRIRRLR